MSLFFYCRWSWWWLLLSPCLPLSLLSFNYSADAIKKTLVPDTAARIKETQGRSWRRRQKLLTKSQSSLLLLGLPLAPICQCIWQFYAKFARLIKIARLSQCGVCPKAGSLSQKKAAHLGPATKTANCPTGTAVLNPPGRASSPDSLLLVLFN